MAVTDAYVTATEYLAAIDQTDTAENTEIDTYLSAVSRLVDRRAGFLPSGIPRHFTKDASVTVRYFQHPGGGDTVMIDGIVPVQRGSARLWVDDIATTTGLIVKVDLNGDGDFSDSGETLTIDTDFVMGPWNAAAGAEAEPYRYIDINPRSTALYGWPTTYKGIQITAVFGWPAVPEAIKRCVIALTKQLRDVSKEPYTLTLENLEQRLPLTTGGVKMLEEITQRYGQKVLTF